jgi:hypothetical protein
VSTTTASPLRWGTSTGTISSAKRPLDGGGGALVGLGRQVVLRLAGQAGRRRVPLGARAHGHLVEGAEQAVVHHRVDDRAVTQAVALAGTGKQVGRLRHRLHAAGDHHLGGAGLDQQIREKDGVEPGQADLVDRGGGNGHGDAGVHRGLAGGDLTGPGLEHLAHEHVVDLAGGDPRPVEGGLDGEAAEVGGLEASQCARELADRRAGTGEDDGTSHLLLPPRVVGWDATHGI